MDQLTIARELELLEGRIEYMASLNSVEGDKVAAGALNAYTTCKQMVAKLRSKVIEKGVEQEEPISLEELQSNPEYKFGKEPVTYKVQMYRKKLFSDEWVWEDLAGIYVGIYAAEAKLQDYSTRMYPANELRIVQIGGIDDYLSR
jgi:hypothetical protein